LTTDEDDLRPVYLSGILTSGVRSRVRDGENQRFISFKFTHDFDYPETLLYKLQKGISGNDSNGNRTENRSTPTHRNMWDGERNTLYHLSKTICHKSTISDEFETQPTELENMGVTSSRL
jgi:hypothetical protein